MKVIGMLAEEARASRLSFNDVAKRLAEQTADADGTFISKKVAGGWEGGGGLLMPCLHLLSYTCLPACNGPPGLPIPHPPLLAMTL